MGVSKVDEVIRTDVLVVGGSGAGVMAATTALESGASVALISKGMVGKSGNAIMIGGGFGIDGESAREYLGIDEADPSSTRQSLFERTVWNSFYLSDQNIVRQFVDESGPALRKLLEWDALSGKQLQLNARGSSWGSSGLGFGKVLRAGIKAIPGVELHEDTIAIDLIVEEGEVIGVLALEVYSGRLLAFLAHSVVLATGGHQPYSLKNSISDMTGDGVALAYRGGAVIADMEFYLYLPTIAAPKRFAGSILPFILSFLAGPGPAPLYRVTDASGKELVVPPEFASIRSKLRKLVFIYYWGLGPYSEFRKGGDAIYFDFSDADDARLDESFAAFEMSYIGRQPKGKYNKIDLAELKDFIRREKRLRVGLGNEYSMGGVAIDESMRAGLHGLYAAGETTSGLFGAFRGGDGLTEMLAQGYRAGYSAAARAKGRARAIAFPSELEGLAESALAPLSGRGGGSPFAARRRLETAADLGFNVVRNQAGLEQALAETLAVKAGLPGLELSSKSRAYNLEWLEALTLRNLCACNEAGIRAALLRKESRGCHLRSDYPAVDPDWALKIEARLEGGAMRISTRSPIVEGMPIPRIGSPTVAAYIADELRKEKGHAR
jgi:succinate dehydrogenase / fumarate reductase flavoprotein subunit